METPQETIRRPECGGGRGGGKWRDYKKGTRNNCPGGGQGRRKGEKNIKHFSSVLSLIAMDRKQK